MNNKRQKELEAERKIDRLQKAVEIARTKGEHYPVCNYSKLKNRPCDCWKSDMEHALLEER